MNLRQVLALFNKSAPEAEQPVHLNGGEHRQLTARHTQVVHVVSGTAWITSDTEDYVVNEDTSVVLKPRQHNALIASLNSKPITYEVQPKQNSIVRPAGAAAAATEVAQIDALTDPVLLSDQSWPWLTKLEGSYPVSAEYSGNWKVSELIIPANGMIVELKGYGWVRVFRTTGIDGEAEYWATSRLDMSLDEAAHRVLDARVHA
jgi:hypothetical protein